MALTQIGDIFKPGPNAQYIIERTKAKSRLINSGAVVTNARLQAIVGNGGDTFSLPAWNGLGSTADVVTSDETTDVLTPTKLDSHTQVAVMLRRAQGWSAADLAAELAGDDPMEAVANELAAYWDRRMQAALIDTLRGVIADNVANDSGDMVNDIGTDSASAITAAELISSDAIIDAQATLGDSYDDEGGGLIVMHSVPFHRLRKQQQIDFVTPADTQNRIATYQGMQVLVDDTMPAIAGTNRIEYYTVMLAPGSIAYGFAMPKVPLAVEREELQGNGGGVETAVSRMHFCLHPKGFAYTASPSGDGPTNTELRAATSWNRVVPERNQVPISVLVTNG